MTFPRFRGTRVGLSCRFTTGAFGLGRGSSACAVPAYRPPCARTSRRGNSPGMSSTAGHVSDRPPSRIGPGVGSAPSPWRSPAPTPPPLPRQRGRCGSRRDVAGAGSNNSRSDGGKAPRASTNHIVPNHVAPREPTPRSQLVTPRCPWSPACRQRDAADGADKVSTSGDATRHRRTLRFRP
jgi:hypothetical protein